MWVETTMMTQLHLVNVLNPLQWCCTATQAVNRPAVIDEGDGKDYKAEDEMCKKVE